MAPPKNNPRVGRVHSRKGLPQIAAGNLSAFGREASSALRAKYNDYKRQNPPKPKGTPMAPRRPAPTKGNVSIQIATEPVLRQGPSRYRTDPSRWRLFKDGVKDGMKSGASAKQRTKEINEISTAGAKARNASLSGKGGWGRQLANRVSQNIARNATQARFTIRNIRATNGVPEKGPVRSSRSPTLARAYLAVTGNKLYPRNKQIPADPNVPTPKPSVPTPKSVNRGKLVAGMRK